MGQSKKLFFYGLLIVISIGILVVGFFVYLKLKSPFCPVIRAIPESTAVFFEIPDPVKTWKKLNENNDIWKELLQIHKIKEFSGRINTLDSLSSCFESVSELLTSQKFYISIHLDQNNRSGFLYLIGMTRSVNENRIHDFVFGSCKGHCSILKTNYNKARIIKIISGDSTNLFTYTIYNGIFIGSCITDLVKEAIDQVDSKLTIASEAFQQVKITAGKKVETNIYINHDNFNKLMKQLASDESIKSLDLISNFAQWSEIDLIIKSDELLLNGYTNSSDSAHQYLSLFNKQDPQRIEVPRILPYNTNILFSFGFENFRKFFHNYRDFLSLSGQLNDHDKQIELVCKKYNIDIVQQISSWLGSDISFVITGFQNDGFKQQTFIVIHAKDRDKAAHMLNTLSINRPELTYKDYTIQQIETTGFIAGLFGNLFHLPEHDYFTNIDDYCIFADHPSSLKNFINSFIAGKTLKRNENYKNFADNISDRSNIFMYFNIRNALNLIKSYLNEPFASLIDQNKQVVGNFEGLAIQFSLNQGMYYTNIFLKYNPSYIQEDLSLWKITLDEEIHGQPYFVRDHRTNTLKIVVFDKDHQMYLIDHNGKIVWKIPIGEEVISDVHTVDYYKNGKIQYLFNTKNYICLIDVLGRYVTGYPVKLPSMAINGLSVFDYEGNRNYRVMIALDDNRIYNYDIKGFPIRGWKKPMAKNPVMKPVQYVRSFGKDYIIITDKEGDVIITDRKGNQRIDIKTHFINAQNSLFYPNKTNRQKGVIITTDQNGKLTYIKNSGRIVQTNFGNFSPDHYFLYEDFNNNGHKDFIYLDKNKLIVYDRFRKPIITHEFVNEIQSSPVIIPVSSTKNIIGIVSEETRKIYLFDSNGDLVSTPDMIGKTQILVGSLFNDGQLNLIVGSGKTLYNYLFR
jgi:hypothetical protein